MKAMLAQELPYEKLTRQLTSQQDISAKNTLNKLGFTDDKTIFQDISVNCGGDKYKLFYNEANKAGLLLEDLYDYALRKQLGIA